ncbi:UNVERIFIED_CONTAM: hypothetical protein Sradi_5676900 [Sesamum radiatum]|uniref:Uncharacterized protein n=1 Tax=Sesamum radiatum TaxID=300843 RepID=A0AAW2L4K5_SESRA
MIFDRRAGLRFELGEQCPRPGRCPARSRQCLDLGRPLPIPRRSFGLGGMPSDSKLRLRSRRTIFPPGRGFASPIRTFDSSIRSPKGRRPQIYAGVFADHIAAILGLPESLPSDSGDYLEDSNDYGTDDTGGDETQSDNQVEEEIFDSEGEEAVGEGDHNETDISAKEALGEDDDEKQRFSMRVSDQR